MLSMEWLRKNLNVPFTRELLREQFLQELKKVIPSVMVQSSTEDIFEFKLSTPTNGPVTCYLNNLWAKSQGLDTDDRHEALKNHVTGMVEMLASKDPKPASDCIVPAIKDQEYLEVAEGSTSPIVHEHLAGDLYIVYCEDRPNSIASLTEDVFLTLAISREGLRKLATDNLRRLLPAIECHGEASRFLLVAGGDYVASILLLDEVWSQLKDYVDGDVVAAVPSRDVLLFTGSKSPEGIRKIKQEAQTLCSTGAYAISSTLLRRTNDGWAVYGD
jgi:uncharacterized protein YtpQ (UPF0354 family)